ncbi:hypothetical protein ACHAXT_002771 [Thalassiosira profunda]
MPEHEAASVEVELASLIDEEGGAGEDTSPPPRSPKQLGSSASSSSGYSSRDVVLFVASFVAAVIFVAVALNSSRGPKKIAHTSNDTDTSSAAAGADGAGGIASWEDLRWRPLSTLDDENCIPGYRLANSTIHCGVGGLSPITNASDGTQLCGGVPMISKWCMMPEEGRWEGVSPEGDGSIAPLHARFGVNANASNNSLPRCETMDAIVNGSFTEAGEYVPDTCRVVPLSPFAWTEHTACQATVTMIGDSHIRNLFTATVNGLRGMSFFAEAHADDAGKAKGVALAYEWRLHANGSATDQFSVYRNTADKDPTPFKDCPCDNEVVQCLRIAFIWAPHFGEQVKQMHFITEWDTDLVILEPGNSYEAKTAVSPEWKAKLEELLSEDEGLHLGILHFPWGGQPKDRKAALDEWTINGTHADRMSYLQQSAVSGGSGGLQGKNTWHFACGLGQEDVRNDKIVAAEPCEDTTDTAQIRAIATVHFGALSKRNER